jgi:hypothetical protein
MFFYTLLQNHTIPPEIALHHFPAEILYNKFLSESGVCGK